MQQSRDVIASPRQTIFAIIGASSGNLVEWFDFYVYAFCAIYFAPQFFPNGNPTTQLLNTAGIFAAGFLMRPIGGWLFGRIADKRGRRVAMLLSVLMMCAGSLAIALLPTYGQLGVAAPLLLLLARLIQGLSVGGEYGTSATYMSEIAPYGRRGFYGAFHYATLIGGQLLAVSTLFVLQLFLSDEQLHTWGWRIPFVVGAVAACVALILRRSLKETVDAKIIARHETGTLKELFKYRRASFMVFGFTAGGSLVFYSFTTYMQKYLVNSVGLAAKSASAIMTGALLIFMLLQPLFGAISDRIGRRNSMIAYGVLSALTTVPLINAISDAHDTAYIFLFIVIALTVASFYTSISGLLKAELFPGEVRALGVGFPYAVGNALFGGTAEYIALYLKANNMESHFFWYVTAMSVGVTLLAIFALDKRGSPYLQK